MQNWKLELIQSVVFGAVRDTWPDEESTLESLWNAWIHRRDSTAVTTGIPGSIGALGDEFHESKVADLLVMMAAFVSALPDEWTDVPCEDDVRAGLRSLGRHMNLRGQALEETTELAAARFTRVMARLRNKNTAPAPAGPSQQFWALRWQDGELRGPEPIGTTKPDLATYSGACNLIVDEASEILRAESGRTMPLYALPPRVRNGLWLAMTYSGGSFGLSEFSRDFNTTIAESGFRKYKELTVKFLEKFIGRSVIATSQSGRYPVPADAWSWLWILRSDDPAYSFLAER